MTVPCPMLTLPSIIEYGPITTSRPILASTDTIAVGWIWWVRVYKLLAT
ncbi:Uncharacterised protein [Legionella pneumophila]|nr:Uncharacterised protein [Legionella pneumophila]